MACSFCGGAAHPATGCQYGERTIACGPCTREFWVWVRKHTNGKASRRRRKTPTALSFYEAAGQKP